MAEKNPIKVIGISGGSGSGKSTVAISLCKKYPDVYTLLQIDDYFKKEEFVPSMHGKLNWDHPDAIDLDKLHQDLQTLLKGEPITIRTKSELYNPDYRKELHNKIYYTIAPKKVILVEGFLAFYDERIRNLFSKKIYLDIPLGKSLKRRTKFVDGDYYQSILTPMFEQYVLPTKEFADKVINVVDKTPEQVEGEVYEFIK